MRTVINQKQILQNANFRIVEKKIGSDFSILIGYLLLFFSESAISKLKKNKFFSFTLKQMFTSDTIPKCFIPGEQRKCSLFLHSP